MASDQTYGAALQAALGSEGPRLVFARMVARSELAITHRDIRLGVGGIAPAK